MKSFSTFFLSFSLLALSGAIIFFALEVQKLREVVPEVKATVDQIPKAIDKSSDEIAKARPSIEKFVGLIPGIVKEVRYARHEVSTTRKEVPFFFDRAEDLVDKAKEVGEESSSGVFLGFIKGAITAPFDLISSIFSSKNHKLTRGDGRLLKRAAEDVLKLNKLDAVKKWRNSESSNSGSVTIASIDIETGCKVLNVIINRDNDTQTQKKVEVCQNSEGMWQLK